MNFNRISTRPLTRGKKRMAEREEMELKLKQKMFEPRLIQSAKSNELVTLIRPNDIITDPNNPEKILIPKETDLKPLIKEEEALDEEELEVEHSKPGFQDQRCGQVEINSKDGFGGSDQFGGVEDAEVIQAVDSEASWSENVAITVETHSSSQMDGVHYPDLEKKLEEKDLRIQELELMLDFQKQRVKDLSKELEDAKRAGFSKDENTKRSDQCPNEDGGGTINSSHKNGVNPVIDAIFGGRSKEEIEAYVKMIENLKIQIGMGDSFLHVAVRTGNLELVRYLVSLRANVNARNVFGSTPLMEAAISADVEVMDILIRNGANVRATNQAGETALFIALEEWRTWEEVQKLCFRNCWKTTNKNDGNTVLHKAAESGNLAAMEYLLSQKPDVNVRNKNGWTPLMSAALAKENFLPIVNLLLKNGANIKSRDKTGTNLLHFAIQSQKSVEDISQLVDAEARWNDKSVLFSCVQHGHVEAIKYFIEKGANVNVKDDWKSTPLMKAAEMGKADMMITLLENGAVGCNHNFNSRFFSTASKEVLDKLSSLGVIWDETLLHNFTINRNLEGIRYCLKNGADINGQDSRGQTPIILAATANQPKVELLYYLKEMGADINAENSMGWNGLHVATAVGKQLMTLQTLIKFGATWSNGVVGNSQRMESILHAAVRGGLPGVVQFFISKGVDVNCRDSEGDTPLLHAVKLSKKILPEMLRVLVSGGANPNAKDIDGNNALLLGLQKSYNRSRQSVNEFVKVLVYLGCDWRAPNQEGVTVLSKLEEDGNSELFEYFKSLS